MTEVKKEDLEIAKEVQYWAGMLIGHEQAYDIAEEIVNTIKSVEAKFNHVDLADVSGSASNVISKMKHLPESDYSLDGQLKLIRVCGNTLGLYKAVKWMQEHYR